MIIYDEFHRVATSPTGPVLPKEITSEENLSWLCSNGKVYVAMEMKMANFGYCISPAEAVFDCGIIPETLKIERKNGFFLVKDEDLGYLAKLCRTEMEAKYLIASLINGKTVSEQGTEPLIQEILGFPIHKLNLFGNEYWNRTFSTFSEKQQEEIQQGEMDNILQGTDSTAVAFLPADITHLISYKEKAAAIRSIRRNPFSSVREHKNPLSVFAGAKILGNGFSPFLQKQFVEQESKRISLFEQKMFILRLTKRLAKGSEYTFKRAKSVFEQARSGYSPFRKHNAHIVMATQTLADFNNDTREKA